MKSYHYAALAAFVSLACVSHAHAHVSLMQDEVVPGQMWDGAVLVPHGCAGSPTIRVEVTVPPVAGAPQAMAKLGWKVETLGTTIIWSGGSLPDGQVGEFTFKSKVAKDALIGSVPVPVVQKCEKGEHRWIEVAQAGQDPHSLKSPAPMLQIVQAHGVKIEQPWVRATPKGAKVAGGFGIFINPGPADRLLSASFPAVTDRTEIHEMAVANGVMTMRALPKGIEIPAGGKLELKPGSYHLMLMDLKAPIVEGQKLTGTLVFEKAGPISVTFPVMAIGAPGPMQDSHQHQHKH